MTIRNSLRPVALATVLALFVGCGGAGSTSTSSGASSARPNPGGAAVALSASGTITPTLTTDAYVAFKEQVSISDMVIPTDPSLADRAFVVEDDGTVRILDLSGATPTLDRALPLLAAPLAAGTATGKIRVQGANLALVTTSGAAAEGVLLFDPATATASTDVTRFDMSAVTVTWPAGTLNSAGADVSGVALPLTYTADAVVAGGKLVFASSNLDATFNNNPGTVTGYVVDLATKQLYGSSMLQTSNFNPTGIARVDTPQGELLLVTNSGAWGVPGASIDLIDPVSFKLVGSIPFAAGAPAGRVVVSPDGARGYVGSQDAPEVFVLDLTGVGLELGNASPASLPARNLGSFAVPTSSAYNYISSVALSYTGNYLYAANFNESVVHVIDLAAPSLATSVTGFARAGNTSFYEGLASTIAVRPGVPGADFQGPSIFAMTINLALADQTVTDVAVALDTVEVDQH